MELREWKNYAIVPMIVFDYGSSVVIDKDCIEAKHKKGGQSDGKN